jgi:membrane dipeptidase
MHLSLYGLLGRPAEHVSKVNFSPTFVADDGEADVSAVADHIEHIARVAGKKQ